MKERPIIFSAPMVRAILEGRKTQTRRVVKNAHVITCDDRVGATDSRCPYGKPGDLLWVKEAFWKHRETGIVRYADGASDASWKEVGWKKVPSIHMPRAASRLTLEVVAVRVERLQEISEVDSIAEGVRQMRDGSGCWVGRDGPGKWVTPWAAAREAFCDIWESINGKCSWDANPWVWVIEFKKAKEVGQ